MELRQFLLKQLLLVALFSGSYGQTFLGDTCYHAAKNADGQCVLLSKCTSAIRDLINSIRPQHCGFDGAAVIVCCVPDPSSTSTTTKTTSTTLTPPTQTPPKRIPGEKSKQKCKDYEDLGYILERPPILIPGQDFIKRNICPWEPGVTPVIIDGEPTKMGEFPHMALLGYDAGNGQITFECGGSLISENFVITAAHCLYSQQYGEPTAVRLGDLNYNDTSDDSKAQQIPIETFYENPSYKPPENYNDLALLKLTRPAKLSIYVKPICLYHRAALDFQKAIVTGWGHTEYGGEKSDHLLKAGLDIFSTTQCNKTYKNDRKALPRGVDERLQLCAGSKTDRKDTCQGDSGGPIQIRAQDGIHCSYYLLGVTSFGKLCGFQNVPAIYAKVYPFIEWIENIVWP